MKGHRQIDGEESSGVKLVVVVVVVVVVVGGVGVEGEGGGEIVFSSLALPEACLSHTNKTNRILEIREAGGLASTTKERKKNLYH